MMHGVAKSKRNGSGKSTKIQTKLLRRLRSVGRKPITKGKKPRPFRSEFAPAVSSTITETMMPRFSGSGVSSDRVCISHRELVTSYNVLGNKPNFQVGTTLSINPGLVASFPWLASQAQGWEKYRFKRLSFHFVTRSGTSNPGVVIMAPDYDASDPAPVNELLLTSKKGCKEAAQWQTFMIELDKKLLGRECFVRVGNLGFNQDVKLYDIGNLYVGDVGTTQVAGAILGSIWADYEVELIQPDISNVISSLGSGTYCSQNSGQGAISDTNPFGAPASWTTYGIQAYTPSLNTATQLTFKGLIPGVQYMFSYGVAMVPVANSAYSTAVSNTPWGVTPSFGVAPGYNIHNTPPTATINNYLSWSATFDATCNIGFVAQNSIVTFSYASSSVGSWGNIYFSLIPVPSGFQPN